MLTNLGRLWLGTTLALACFACLAWMTTLPAITAWDHTFSRWLQSPDSPFLTAIGLATEWLFSPQVSLPLVALLAGYLWISGRRATALSLLVFFALVLAGIGLKFLLRVPSPQGVLVVRTLTGRTSAPPSSLTVYSFPSGHVARAAFLLFWIFAAARRALSAGGLLAAAILSLFVAWTRIYVGDHYFLDVLGAFALAGAALVPALVLLPARHRQPSALTYTADSSNALARLRPG